MTHAKWMIAFGLIAAAAPAWSAGPAMHDAQVAEPAPPGTPDTRYCMRIEPITGSRIEKVKCWTRAEWADREVDVDKEWAEEGVRVVG